MLFSVIILLLALLAIDFYAFRGLGKLLSHHRLVVMRKLVLKSYWLVDVIFIVFSIIWAWYIRSSDMADHDKYRKFFVIMGGFMLIFLPKFILFLFTLLHDFKLIVLKLVATLLPSYPFKQKKLLRWRRSFIIPAAGVLAAMGMFFATIYGVGIGRFSFTVVEQDVFFSDLPESFDGYRVVQFSDTHLGSYGNTHAVRSGLEIINGLRADMIVFTGDMVNNEASEAFQFIPFFQKLHAKDGLFSILGNHDMGDYRRWGTIEEKESNLDELIAMQREMGFRLLLNEHAIIYRDADSIMIAGVLNWGLPPFAQHGDLHAALGNYENRPFTILLSHDPSHWRAQIIPESEVQLTLSGHTHGMQMGFSNRLFSWSPVKYKYNEWNGLYEEASQKLYVNRGFGFLSFPGRIGMPPEITVITLRKG